jgi:hypothetical protein
MFKLQEDLKVNRETYGNLLSTIQVIDDCIKVLSVPKPCKHSDANKAIAMSNQKKKEVEELLNNNNKEFLELLEEVGMGLCHINSSECLKDGVRCKRKYMVAPSEEPCKTCFEGQFKTGKYKNWVRD